MSTVQQRARSRLSQQEKIEFSEHKHRSVAQRLKSNLKIQQMRFLHIGVLAALSIAAVILFCATIPPEKVANILFFHSYLPFLATVGVMVFFVTLFVLLHTRRAVLLALFCTSLLFLQLQEIMLTPLTICILALIFISVEATSLLAIKK